MQTWAQFKGITDGDYDDDEKPAQLTYWCDHTHCV